MPEVSFTQEDIVSSQAMEAGWYPVTLKDISEGPGKKDPSSTTWTSEFEVIDGAYKGVVILYSFSSKMMKNVIQYVACFVGKPEPGKSYPLEATKGKPIMAYVKFDMDFNKNAIAAFKPIGK